MRNMPVTGPADHSGIPRTITFPSVQTVSTSYSEPMLETICGPDMDSSCGQLLFNKPGVAGVVLQTPFLIHSYSESLSDPFPLNLQNTVFPKP